jgi:hypothetical protein
MSAVTRALVIQCLIRLRGCRRSVMLLRSAAIVVAEWSTSGLGKAFVGLFLLQTIGGRSVARFQPKVFIQHSGSPREQEEAVARHLSGKRQAGSGSSIYAKGDVIQRSNAAHSLDRFLIECKQTIHASLSVKGEWLSKITREAAAAGKEPALSIEIRGNDDPVTEAHWVAIPMSVFKRLFDE